MWCDESAHNVVSAKAVTAHSPAPAARAHLIRRASHATFPSIHCDLRSSGEGFMTAYFENTDTHVVRVDSVKIWAFPRYADIKFRCAPKPSPRGEGVTK